MCIYLFKQILKKYFLKKSNQMSRSKWVRMGKEWCTVGERCRQQNSLRNFNKHLVCAWRERYFATTITNIHYHTIHSMMVDLNVDENVEI